MPYRRFVFWDVFGGICWITSILWVGYWLGGTEWANRLDKLIIIVIFVSFLPIVFHALMRWWKARRGKSAGPEMVPASLPEESE
jgi:membrane-associated protein